MSRKYIAVGLLAGLTAGTGAGLILQQTGTAGAAAAAAVAQDDDDTTTDTTDTTVTEADADEASQPGDRLATVLAPLVADGTLTQAQADAVVEALVAARPERGPGHGPGRGGHHGPRGAKLDTVATVLGITVDELRTALQSGQTIADVAGDQTQAVIDALVAEATERIEQGVTDGRLTREEADAKLAELTDKITDKVNNVPADADDAPADTEG